MEELEMNTEICIEDASNKGADEELTDQANTNDTEDDTEGNNKNEDEKGSSTATVDYGEIEKQDLEELRSLFPHLKAIESITELQNPLRYAALRDLGLTPREAYMATNEPVYKYDNRSHLRSSVPKGATSPTGLLTSSELEAARELFSGLSDREIQKLYKKVSR